MISPRKLAWLDASYSEVSSPSSRHYSGSKSSKTTPLGIVVSAGAH